MGTRILFPLTFSFINQATNLRFVILSLHFWSYSFRFFFIFLIEPNISSIPIKSYITQFHATLFCTRVSIINYFFKCSISFFFSNHSIPYKLFFILVTRASYILKTSKTISSILSQIMNFPTSSIFFNFASRTTLYDSFKIIIVYQVMISNIYFMFSF
jgi:hypothetical protein